MAYLIAFHWGWLLASLLLGIERSRGWDHLLGMGEMGIANTTAASAVAAALTGGDPAAVIGRGTGADEVTMARKRSAVERALALHRPHLHGPLDVLARLGGFEIGAMAGLCLGAAARRCAVLVDGFIATAAAALAVRFQPAVRRRHRRENHAARVLVLFGEQLGDRRLGPQPLQPTG